MARIPGTRLKSAKKMIEGPDGQVDGFDDEGLPREDVTRKRLAMCESKQGLCSDEGRQCGRYSKAQGHRLVGVAPDEEEFEEVIGQVHDGRRGHRQFDGEEEGEGRQQQRPQPEPRKETEQSHRKSCDSEKHVFHPNTPSCRAARGGKGRASRPVC